MNTIRIDQAHTTKAGPHRKKVELSLSEAIPVSSTSTDRLPIYSQNFLTKTGHSSKTNKLMTALTAISQEPDQAQKRTKYENFFAQLFNGSYIDAELTDDNLDQRIGVLRDKLQERLNFNDKELAGMSSIGRIMAHPAASPVAAVVAAMTLLVSAAGNIPAVADFAERYAPNNSFVDSWSSETVTNGLERFKRFGLEEGLVGSTFKVGDFLSPEGHNYYLTTDDPYYRRIYELLYAQIPNYNNKNLELGQFNVTFDNSTKPPGTYPLSSGSDGDLIFNLELIKPDARYANVFSSYTYDSRKPDTASREKPKRLHDENAEKKIKPH
ncbi:MAG: hypothetical protein RLZZ361_1489 [Cyanobacteriota bacterium]|jgi:hypothetical protein